MTKVKLQKYELDGRTPTLERLGLVVNSRVRFRHHDEDHWSIGVLKGDFKDGSLTIVDKDGKWRSIMPEKVQVASKGPRGGKKWESIISTESDSKNQIESA